MKLSINGKFVRQIRLNGTEPELHYGYGVFETIRTYHGQLFELATHLLRLRTSAKSIQLKLTPSDAQLQQWLLKHCRQGEYRIKIIAAPQHIYIFSTRLSVNPHIYRAGIAITTYPGERMQPTVKGNAWVLEYLAYEYAKAHGFFDALLVGAHGAVPEAACGNFFVVRRGTIYTANNNVLSGITRGVVLRLIEQTPYRVRFVTNRLKNLATADECFMTKTTTGIVPVVRINKTRIGTGKPGPVTKRLMELFAEYVETSKG